MTPLNYLLRVIHQEMPILFREQIRIDQMSGYGMVQAGSMRVRYKVLRDHKANREFKVLEERKENKEFKEFKESPDR